MKSRRACRRAASVALAGAIAWLALPARAQAHGPVAPVATSYLARITSVPQGLRAKVVDGYVRMWLQAPPAMTVVVLDYAGAPYLRFSHGGVDVNLNSAMYYLNQTPVAAVPPSSLNRFTRPRWQPAAGGNSYEWHDGRLQALASVALAPGARYVGRWSIPLLLDGRRTAIVGGLWHADDPPLIWFWPIVVVVACVLAAARLPRPGLHAQLARGLGIVTLVALAIAAVGRELHGRPTVPVGQYLELGVILAFVALALFSVIRGRAGYFLYCVIAFVALWEGLTLVPTLLHGYVLIDLPAFAARAVTVLCIGCGAATLPLVFRLAEVPSRKPGGRRELQRSRKAGRRPARAE